MDLLLNYNNNLKNCFIYKVNIVSKFELVMLKNFSKCKYGITFTQVHI